MTEKSLMKRLLSEPLAHFLLIGLGLFLLYSKVGAPEPDDEQLIEIDAAGVERLATSWSSRWNRPPTTAELQGVIAEYVREEVLYREALKLGLDADDSIVRRRMAQKMDFLFRDLTAPAQVSDDELEAYLQENQERFRLPARYSFSHIYLNPDRRGPNIRKDAVQILEYLRSTPAEEVELLSLGDRFMLQHQFDDNSETEVSRSMGSQFTEGLAGMEVGSWQGPVLSGYGLHLVHIRHKTDSRMPALSEIRSRVENDYRRDRQNEANQAFYDTLRAQYDVRIEMPGGSGLAAARDGTGSG
jgi:hypothetical protein